MAVRARVVCVAFVAALVAPLEMTAERRGTATFDGAQYPLLPHGQRFGMRSAKLIAMGAHNIGDFQCRSHKEAGDLLWRINYGIGQQIQRARCGAHGAGGEEKVACRGGQTAVTE